MKKITRLSGVRVSPGNGLARVVVSEDDLAVAQMPDLLMWIEAGARFKSDDDHSLLDRVTGNRLYPLSTSDSNQLPVLGSFSSGADSLEFAVDGMQPYRAASEQEFVLNPNEWSFVMVLHPVAGNSPDEIIGPYDSETDPDSIHVRFGLSSSNKFNLWTGSTNARLSTPADAGFYGNDLIVAVTFNVTDGIKIMVNGVAVAENKTDLRPLTNPSFKIGGNGSTTNIFGGKIGHILAFNTDISRDEYAGYREKMEAIFKARYGIS